MAPTPITTVDDTARMRRISSERAEALVAKEAEIQRLCDGLRERDSRLKTVEAAAAERLQALQQAHAELAAIRAEALERSHDQDRLTEELAARELRIISLEKTAQERLDALLEANAALRSISYARGNANIVWRILTRIFSALLGIFRRNDTRPRIF
ncbi:MAG: hypothetical protein EXQ52_12960 [Bryobacterales bacterium]|nr:hypothetical protein [Bryobacterales bacterium]